LCLRGFVYMYESKTWVLRLKELYHTYIDSVTLSGIRR
jgi:hypothetical protein